VIHVWLSVKNLVRLQSAWVALAKARRQRFEYRVSQKKAPEKRSWCFTLPWLAALR
jgi:hypothetical protein